MKFVFVVLSIMCTLNYNCAQENELIGKINNLKFVTDMPYYPELSGDSIFWVVVKEKIIIVPFLIEQLDDTSSTKAIVPNFGGNYTVADIAYNAISKIIRGIPTLELAEDPQNPEPRNGYWGYWDYTRRNFENRIKFQVRVKQWFENNKNNLIWVEDSVEYKTDTNWKFKNNKNPAGGYYIIKN